jgi:hypothetical protein
MAMVGQVTNMPIYQQTDWTKNKPSLADQLRSDIQCHERYLDLAILHRRYSIYKSQEDFQLSLDLTRSRLALKRQQLSDLELVGAA